MTRPTTRIGRMQNHGSKLAGFLLLSMALCSQGCFLFDSGNPAFPKPTLAMKSATLVQNPTPDQLLSYYCPQLLSSLLCAPVFGGPPPKADLKFFFEMRFDAGNSGDLPVPMIEMLLALDVFPGEEQESLGSVCVRFCPADDATCSGEPGPNSCTSDKPDIDSIEDFGQAIQDFIFAAATGQVDFADENLNMRIIPPGQNIDISVVFGLDVDKVLELLIVFVDKLGNQLLNGQDIVFDIPYSARGTLFFDVPYFGRFPLGFGPFEDVWEISP